VSGDCFVVAFQYVFDHRADDRVRLCHGLPVGTGKANMGERFDHAWVEVGDLVIDKSNGNDVMVTREFYYRIGRIVPDSVDRYTAREAAMLALESGHYGPWDGGSAKEQLAL